MPMVRGRIYAQAKGNVCSIISRYIPYFTEIVDVGEIPALINIDERVGNGSSSLILRFADLPLLYSENTIGNQNILIGVK